MALPRDRYDDRRDNRGGRFDRRIDRDAESDYRRRGRSASPTDKETPATEEPPVKKKKEEIDPILTRTGGAYIPPAKLRMMQQQITDKSRYVFSIIPSVETTNSHDQSFIFLTYQSSIRMYVDFLFQLISIKI